MLDEERRSIFSVKDSLRPEDDKAVENARGTKRTLADSSLIPPRRITQDEFDRAVAAHSAWLQDPGYGVNADFQYCDLRSIKVPPNLNLQKALFVGALLTECDFRRAILRDCDMRFADLGLTRLEIADLSGADLSEARNLVSSQLAGANLEGTHLPAGVEFPNVDASNKIAEMIFKLQIPTLLAGIAILAYCWSTTDVNLIADAPAKSNPVASVELTFLALGVLTPAVMLMVFLFTQFHFQRLWECLSMLPAIFPSGSTIEERVPLWAGTGILKLKAAWRTRQIAPLARMQFAFDVMLLWWWVPCVLALLWFRYLVCHLWRFSLLHAGLLASAAVAAYSLQELAFGTLGHHFPFKRALFWNPAETVPISVKHGIIWLAVFGVIACLSLVSETVVGWPFAQIQDAQVSTISPEANRTLLGTDEGLKYIKGANLRFRDLRNADATGAMLANTDFERAELAHADFRNADLRHANFSGADLRGAKLDNARVDGADMHNVDLTTFTLSPAQLQVIRK